MTPVTRRGPAGLRRADISTGDRFERVLVDNLTRTQIVQYAGASGDYNPIHTDERFAVEAAGYSSVFAHGMLTMGLLGTMLTDLVGDGRLRQFGARFVKQVWPGDTLTGVAEVTGVRTSDAGEPVVDLTLTVTNQHGERVLTGTAIGALDG